MKTAPNSRTLAKIQRLQDRINELDQSKKDLSKDGYGHLAEHVESIIGDLSFEQALILETEGPLVWSAK